MSPFRPASRVHTSPLELPPATGKRPGLFVCRLYYRPLREGDGEGDPAPWTVESFSDHDGAVAELMGAPGAARGGPARDALAELARGGRRWLAFVATSGGRICGEYVVRGGDAEPLAPYWGFWPVAWWERCASTRAADMLDASRLPVRESALAALACWRVALDMNLRVTDVDRAAAERARAAWDDTTDEARRLSLVERSFLHVIEACDLIHSLDRIDQETRRTDAWAAWNEAARREVRRCIGDAWFIARTDPKLARE